MHVQLQTRDIDVRIGELADRQHGVVARRQLLELGLTREAIGVRVEGNRLHPLHRGVYAVGHRVLSQRARWMAAVLAAGPGAVLSHRSAAALWGIRSHSSHAIEVTTPHKTRSRAGFRRRFALLPPDEVTEVDGIPVTTVPRTVFDLGSVAPVAQVEHALRESERLRLHDALSLSHLLERYPRRRGSRAIRECLRRRRDSPAGVSRKALEERFLAFLDQRGLPRPRRNAWVMLGSRRYQVDCLWPEQQAIAELDGYATHGTQPAFHDDRDRDRRLTAAGYRGIRVTWRHLDELPDEVAADLWALLTPSR
jgi:predicted transcriptional regulator of viral defense system